MEMNTVCVCALVSSYIYQLYVDSYPYQFNGFHIL